MNQKTLRAKTVKLSMTSSKTHTHTHTHMHTHTHTHTHTHKHVFFELFFGWLLIFFSYDYKDTAFRIILCENIDFLLITFLHVHT